MFMNFIYKLLLKNYKRKALLETETDIAFIKMYRKKELDYNEAGARKKIREENLKPEDQRNQTLLNLISHEIANHNAVKKELDELIRLRNDLKSYINMI